MIFIHIVDRSLDPLLALDITIRLRKRLLLCSYRQLVVSTDTIIYIESSQVVSTECDTSVSSCVGN